jgi:choline dehydrogenase
MKGADIVIVGAGSAGSVIASRLSAHGDRSILLLEAGPDYPDPSTLPADLARGGRNSMTRHDWGYKHHPSRRGIRFPFPRGRVVGGSSAVNTCIALRGQPEDFDEWAARGLPEWSWEHCLPAFRRLETDLDFDDAWHGNQGPLPLRRHPPEELAVWQQAFLSACSDLGYPACDDSNRPGSQGAGPHAMNKINGRRISAAEAWLTTEVRGRRNLRLQSDTQVHRVLFDGRRAIGVEVKYLNDVTTIRAGEVILCAGAINTPGILLRSGVGPSSDLDRLGVELIAEVPAVGRRLLDHHGTAIFFRPRWGAPTHRKDDLLQTVLRYDDGSHPTGIQVQPGSALALPRVSFPLVSVMCSIGKPRDSGSIFWKSASPTARPVIRTHCFQDKRDRSLAVDAISLAYELSRSSAMHDLARPFWPRERVMRDKTRLKRWVQRVCDSGYHPCGTVPMGSDDDPDAATDGRGRVRGVENLRVADASLMPTIPSGNIHLPTLMIGERIAAFLKR